MKELKKYFFTDKKQLFLTIIILVFHALFETGYAVMIWYLFDLLGKATEVMPIVYFGLIFVGYTLLAALANAADLYYTGRYIAFITATYRKDLYDNIFRLSYSDFQKNTSDEYITLINRDVSTISENFFRQCFSFFYEFMLFISAVVISFLMNYIVAAILLVSSFLVIVFPMLFTKKLARQVNQVSEDNLEFSKYIGNTFTGIDILQNYGAVHNIANRIDSLNQNIYRSETRQHKLIGEVNIGNYFIVSMLQTSAALISGILTVYGKSTIAISISFLNIAGYVFNPISAMLSCYLDISSTKDIVRKIASIKPRQEEKEDFLSSVGKIRLENLGIRFSSKVLFENVSYTFQTHKKYLLVGESGCGKTTLLETLLGHNGIYSGQIIFDEKEGKSLSSQTRNALISYCPQTPHLFIGSLKENITLFSNMVDEKKLESVIELCELKDFKDIRGLDAPLDLSDNRISLGEMQRISLCRALYFDKPVLFLDEITASLDDYNRKKIYEVIKKIDNKMILWISHDEEAQKLSWIDDVIYIRDKTFQKKAP